ncbi:MAG: hypothetical protein EOP85_17310 [Verrucomicrobiaceae bacterium]|nr:MAG: hypothetical protein EOP85_17310 [Verrucomicrobiaceae bacterium]
MVEGILCERLGGVTSYPARGTFKMDDGHRTSDNLQVLESFCELGEWGEHKPFLLTLAGIIGGILDQESIACAIDGRMEVVAPIPGAEVPGLKSPEDISETILTDIIVRLIADQTDA